MTHVNKAYQKKKLKINRVGLRRTNTMIREVRRHKICGQCNEMLHSDGRTHVCYEEELAWFDAS